MTNTEELNEGLESDCQKFAEAIRHLYGIDNVVILTRKGDTLGTFGEESAAVAKAIIMIADKFHNKGVKSF